MLGVILKSSDLAIVRTFHNRIYVTAVLQLIALRYQILARQTQLLVGEELLGQHHVRQRNFSTTPEPEK